MGLVLGSSSQWRRDWLRRAGFRFSVRAADIDEKAVIDRRSSKPEDVVLAIARAKSETLRARLDPSGYLITADLVVVFDGKILEKPVNLGEARRFLRAYGKGRPVKTVTAIVITNLITSEQREAVSYAEIVFDPISVLAVEDILSRPATLESAGALVTDDPHLQPFIRSTQGEQGGIQGMPIPTTRRLLAEVGYQS